MQLCKYIEQVDGEKRMHSSSWPAPACVLLHVGMQPQPRLVAGLVYAGLMLYQKRPYHIVIHVLRPIAVGYEVHRGNLG